MTGIADYQIEFLPPDGRPRLSMQPLYRKKDISVEDDENDDTPDGPIVLSQQGVVSWPRPLSRRRKTCAKEVGLMPDLRVISWNIKDFANTRYTKNRDIIQRQLYDAADQQLCDLFVIIEPRPGVKKGKLGQVVSKGSGYKAMLALYNWLFSKSAHWKMVPPLMSSSDTRVDCVAVYYDSSKIALEGPNLNELCPEPRPLNPPWKDVHPGQIRHCDLNGAKLNFQGRNPYLIKFRDVAAAAETVSWNTTLTIKAAAPVPVVPVTVLSITSPATLPTATCGAPYNTAFAVGGAKSPVTWKWKSGSTPPVWLHLHTATGALQGTPPAVGSFTFDVDVTDASSSVSQSCTLEVKTVAITVAADRKLTQ
ncbi:Ig domain-containing protein [Pseudomonas sp. PCH446]